MKIGRGTILKHEICCFYGVVQRDEQRENGLCICWIHGVNENWKGWQEHVSQDYLEECLERNARYRLLT
jgi:hypothetical protein